MDEPTAAQMEAIALLFATKRAEEIQRLQQRISELLQRQQKGLDQ